MGTENSKLRASSLRLLRTLSGRKYSSKFSSSESLARSDRKKTSSSRQQSGNKPKSDSVRSKTKWPYPHVEKDFLPVYNMKAENQKDFTVVNVIASGAYGSVLRGLEAKTQRAVAIKVIDKSRVLSEGQGAIQQCKDEVLIQSDLPKNPYIVQLVSFWQTRNRLYLVLEYIPNGELFDLWKSVRVFSESLARFYLSEIAMAIDFLHRNNVVYRDLKMENILLDSDAHIKVIDFGLSKRLSDGERTTTTCGTLQYTAPEVLRGEPYEHSIDWWSMGVLGYALMNGKFPVFGAKNHVEMRTMVANHQYRMPIHLTNEAADVLTMLLQKNVSSRIKGIDDLINSRFFKGCLNNDGPRLELKRFLTKEDLNKIPDSYHLRTHFEMVYCDSTPMVVTRPLSSVAANESVVVDGLFPAGDDCALRFVDDTGESPVARRPMIGATGTMTTAATNYGAGTGSSHGASGAKGGGTGANPSREALSPLRYARPKQAPSAPRKLVADHCTRKVLTDSNYGASYHNHEQHCTVAVTDTHYNVPVTFDTYPRARNS